MDPRPTTLEDLLVDLDAEHRDLDSLVATLDESGWGRATPAVGWTIRDQVGHLSYFDDAATLAITDPRSFAELVTAAMAATDPMEEHLLRGRALTGPEVLAWWRDSRATMLTATRSLPDGARVSWFGPPMGVLSFVSARLMETWAHGQDVADALELPRSPTRRLRHIADLGVRTRPFSYAIRGIQAPLTPVRVVLSGPAGELWRWEDPAAGSDSVQGSALDFCLVVTQRRNLADTDLVVDGDAATPMDGHRPGLRRPPGLRSSSHHQSVSHAVAANVTGET